MLFNLVFFLGARAAAREGGSRCAATDMSAAACASLISSVIFVAPSLSTFGSGGNDRK